MSAKTWTVLDLIHPPLSRVEVLSKRVFDVVLVRVAARIWGLFRAGERSSSGASSLSQSSTREADHESDLTAATENDARPAIGSVWTRRDSVAGVDRHVAVR